MSDAELPRVYESVYNRQQLVTRTAIQSRPALAIVGSILAQMRLREMRQILEATTVALNAIKFEVVGLPGGQHGGVVREWRPALVAVRELARIEALKPETNAVLDLAWSELAGDPATTLAAVSSPMAPTIHQLRIAVNLLRRMIDSLLPDEVEPTISVRLPQPQNLDDFEKFVKAINFALARPADVLFGPCIRFSNVDAGSTWIDLVIEAVKTPEGGAGAVAIAGSVALTSARKNVLAFLGGLVDLYGKLIRMRQRHRMVEAHLRSIGMASAADEAAKRHSEEADKLAAEDVERIVRLYGVDSEHQADAIRAALQATNYGPDLLEKGAEFHARLGPSNSAKFGGRVEGWPDPKEIRRLVSNPLAQLPATTNGEGGPAAPAPRGGAEDHPADDS